MQTHFRNFIAASFAAALAGAGSVSLAHHGWSWAEEDQIQIEGTIERISMSPPHPTLHIVDGEGTLWQVDLGNPNQTRSSGFSAETAEVGDAIIVIGNRSLDPAEAHIKAVRIVLDGQNYDMYPSRIQTN